MLTHAYLPRYVVHDDGLAVGYAAVAHFHDGCAGLRSFIAAIGQRKQSLTGYLVVKQRVKPLTVSIIDSGQQRQLLDGYDGIGKGRYLIDVA